MPDSDFGTLLRAFRAKANLSQEDLAARAGLSTQAVGALERGERRAPYRQTLDALATALDLGAKDRASFKATARRFREAPVTSTRSKVPPPHNLPLAPGDLIGRDDAVASTSAMLARSDVRLLAITGPAGVGKTRLAIALATQLLPTCPDGAWFVDLAPIRDPALVIAAISQALNAPTPGTTSTLAALQTALRPKRLLLVLDNLEQVLTTTPDLEALLIACPQLQLLVTSRVTLPTPWAHEYILQPLALPNDQDVDLLALATSPAIDLFVQRARARVPDFQLTTSNAPDVAALCRQLDGLPLALELAAMRLRLLPPAELLARLTDRFGLLRSVHADRPARHQQLREALALSEELLSPAQQRLFRRLAIFAGGATVSAIESVCAEPDTIILDEMAVLVDHHLIRREQGAPESSHLTQLETIREYALERLREAGEEAEFAARHARYFREQVEGFEPRLIGPDQLQLFGWCDRERENLRTALAWYRLQDDRTHGLQLCWDLWRWWSARGQLTEARQWFDCFLDPAGQVLPGVMLEHQALALFAAARLAYEQDDLPAAQCRSEQSLRLHRLHDPVCSGSGALTILAFMAFRRGDYQASEEYHTEALQMRRNGPFERDICVSLNGLGDIAAARDDLLQAEAHYHEALTIARAAGDGQQIAATLIRLSRAEERLGRRSVAQIRVQDGLAISRELGERQLTAMALRQLAHLSILAEDYRQVRAYLDEALAIAQAIGSNDVQSRLVDDYARLLAALGDQAHLLQLISAASANREAKGTRYLPHQRTELDELIAVARRELGPAESEQQQAAGAALTLDDALQIARCRCVAALST